MFSLKMDKLYQIHFTKADIQRANKHPREVQHQLSAGNANEDSDKMSLLEELKNLFQY
jgi:hypothetical protein